MKLTTILSSCIMLLHSSTSMAFGMYKTCHGGMNRIYSGRHPLSQNAKRTITGRETSVDNPAMKEEFKDGLPRTNQICGIIFDMDGTIIEHCIDFADIRRRVYELADADPALKHQDLQKRRGDVIELCKTFSKEGQILVRDVFNDVEAKAIRDMKLMNGLAELCHFLDAGGIKRAILTRNVQLSVDAMQSKLREEDYVKEFFPTVNRETVGKDGNVLASKPSPQPILHICDIWNCSPSDVIMVGDSAADDIVAANRANCAGKVLLKLNGKDLDNDAGGGDAVTEDEKKEREPTVIVHSLKDLHQLLVNNYE